MRTVKRSKNGQSVPTFIEPMQPEMVAKLPEGKDWQYEVKWDGYRMLVVKTPKAVTLWSRNKKDHTERYPGVVAAVRALPADNLVIDGELVALDSKGRPSFQLLQNYSSRQAPLAYVSFDLLNFEGRSLLDVPLVERQKLLTRLVDGTSIEVSSALGKNLKAAFKTVRRLKLEGIVAKQRSSAYHPGLRGEVWFKHRLDQGQEFVIGGFSNGNPFDAVLVGYYDGKKLIYVAKVKAGFTPILRRTLANKLEPLLTDRCPFANLPEQSGGRWGEGLTEEKMQDCRWVKPRLVAQVNFLEWTDANHLRHSTFVGLRDDKRPKDVVREQ